MPVIAVINRKGGSGKSTLATQLAGCLAGRGTPVMLGDLDRQQSSLAWLRRRAAQAHAPAAIAGSAFGAGVPRPPAGISYVVLDTAGGLQGHELARIALGADAILMPVGDSVFDRESALLCHAELMALPRVAAGRCRVAVVGMRLDARTHAAARLQAWAGEHGLAYAGSLRDSRIYTRCAEQGLSLFDAAPAKVAADLAQWRPVVEWVDAALAAARRLATASRSTVPASAPSIAPHALARRRAAVRAPLAAARGPASEFRPARPLPPTPRTGGLGWLFAVFRARA